MIVGAILLPWLAVLLGRHPFKAIACLLLQLTVVGWIPAAIWAVAVVRHDRREKQYQQMLRILHGR
ncbi:YqaE/Pmp3 family membrane protein [Rhodopila globiformis]|uniref:YqaE/Pmp3 family membrane protein n=1 Tax=Rhodopila globiformis TaxID=1071 RepID=A0A2S6N7F2_RHOGL|nr:YqaE/Pmp3 family membrane protein [Rhodopila globiformis]PPQ30543.1 hypothetical protein CCS01_19020 [Rhodopila globiformis]